MANRHAALWILLTGAFLLAISTAASAAVVTASSVTFTFTSPAGETYGGPFPVLELQVAARAVRDKWGGGGGLNKAQAIVNFIIAAQADEAIKKMNDPTFPLFWTNITATAAPVIDPKTGQPDPDKGTLTIGNLVKNTSVGFIEHVDKPAFDQKKIKITGERRDRGTTRGKDPIGVIGFVDPAGFGELDPEGNSSAFTGGIVTDKGELVFTVMANELPTTVVNGQPVVLGSDIVAALYDRLSPTIDDFGAEIINYHAGDNLLTFFFDPDRTLLSEVDFGSTVAADGVFGSITAAQSVPETSSLVMLAIGALALVRFRAGTGRALSLLPDESKVKRNQK